MTNIQRQTYLKIAAFSVVGLAVLDYLICEPAYAAWVAQGQRIDALHAQVERGQQLIDREDTIRQRWAQMTHANLPTEISAAQNVAFQAIDRWARDSGISVASLTPNWLDHDEGFQTLEWRVSATGSQAALSRFIYEVETDAIPANLDEFELTARNERGSDLAMTARLSFLQMQPSGRSTP